MQNILHISQIPNFNREQSYMPIYKTLGKSSILKILKKESTFLHSRRHKLQFFFWFIGVFTFLGVAIFRVTLHDPAQIFVKKATIYENGMYQFVFIFSTGIKYEE